MMVASHKNFASIRPMPQKNFLSKMKRNLGVENAIV